MFICLLPIILVDAVSLKMASVRHARMYYLKSTLNRNFYCVGTSMRALDSAFRVELHHLTHPVCHVTVLFVRGVNGCCLCVINCLCVCSMGRATMRVVHIRASSTTAAARLITCLSAALLVRLLLYRRLLGHFLTMRRCLLGYLGRYPARPLTVPPSGQCTAGWTAPTSRTIVTPGGRGTATLTHRDLPVSFRR